MQFSLTEEQLRLRQDISEFANQVIAPLAHIVDKTGQIPAEIIDKGASLGLFGLPFPGRWRRRDRLCRLCHSHRRDRTGLRFHGTGCHQPYIPGR